MRRKKGYTLHMRPSLTTLLKAMLLSALIFAIEAVVVENGAPGVFTGIANADVPADDPSGTGYDGTGCEGCVGGDSSSGSGDGGGGGGGY